MLLLPDNPGDILSVTPLIRCLKTQVEDSYIYSILPAQASWVLNGNPHVDEIITFDKKPDELILWVKEMLPDYFIDLEGEKTYSRLKRKTKVLAFPLGRARDKGEAITSERLFKTVDLFDVEDDHAGIEFFHPPFNPEWLPEKFVSGYAVLAIDAPAFTSLLHEDQLVELVSLIEKPLVLTGTAGERKLAERIGQRTGCTVFPSCGDFTQPETATIFSASKVVISYQSCWPAIAEALGKPVINIGADSASDLPEIARKIRQCFS